MSKGLILFATALLAVLGGVSAGKNQVTFCQRYTNALNGVTTPTSALETALVSAVVDRALSGNTTRTANNMPVTGVLNSNIQRPFFTAPTNFYTNSAAATELSNKLKSFFTVALGCTEVTSPGTFSSNLQSIHAGMNITAAVWNDFVNIIGGTLASFGVGTADVTYAAKLLGQFAYGAGSNMQICNFRDCPMAENVASFISGTNDANTLVWIDQAATTDFSDMTVDIGLNGWVHWDFGLTHSVIQTDSSFATLSNGFTSGTIGTHQVYNYQFTTAGIYYFKCGNTAHPAMQGVIRVAQSSGGGAAGLTASLGAVVAAIAAVVLARRI